MQDGSRHDGPGALRLAATVIAPFAAGFFLSYMLRAVNAVVAPDLVRDVGLTASELGLLTSAYLIAFSLFQVPLGVLLDRFGPRRVQTALLLTSALGSALFSMGDDVVTLSAARALIGLGFAGGLMAGFKAVVLWYPPDRHALANACVLSFGGLGMIVATVPAEMAVRLVGWRGLFVATALVTAAVAVFIFAVVPERRDRPVAQGSVADQLRDVLGIYSDPFFWRIAPLLFTTAGTHIAIHTLWSGPWFRDIAGLDREGVALYLLMTAAAFLVGSLLSGLVADAAVRRGIDQLHVMIGIMVLYLVSQLGIVLETTAITIPVWVVFGMTGQVAILAYPRLAAHFGTARSGRAHTAMNLLLFMSAFAAQGFIGVVIDLFPATPTGGYDPRGYAWAFGLLLLVQVAALGWYALPRRGARART